ncbi:hypothetical protein EDB89DRAFT_2243498, partial [Lactarius sanguifluus]
MTPTTTTTRTTNNTHDNHDQRPRQPEPPTPTPTTTNDHDNHNHNHENDRLNNHNNRRQPQQPLDAHNNNRDDNSEHHDNDNATQRLATTTLLTRRLRRRVAGLFICSHTKVEDVRQTRCDHYQHRLCPCPVRIDRVRLILVGKKFGMVPLKPRRKVVVSNSLYFPPDSPLQGSAHSDRGNHHSASNYDDCFGHYEAEYEHYAQPPMPPILPSSSSSELSHALAKQYYKFVAIEWLDGDPAQPPPPPPSRKFLRNNKDWMHFHASDMRQRFSLHSTAVVDPAFPLTRNFSDVNPPVHAQATFRVFKIERKLYGHEDVPFLERVFQILLLNFTWWVNRKDAEGANMFKGGFLGLDNIGVFNRSEPLSTGTLQTQKFGALQTKKFGKTIELDKAFSGRQERCISIQDAEHLRPLRKYFAKHCNQCQIGIIPTRDGEIIGGWERSRTGTCVSLVVVSEALEPPEEEPTGALQHIDGLGLLFFWFSPARSSALGGCSTPGAMEERMDRVEGRVSRQCLQGPCAPHTLRLVWSTHYAGAYNYIRNTLTNTVVPSLYIINSSSTQGRP